MFRSSMLTRRPHLFSEFFREMDELLEAAPNTKQLDVDVQNVGDNIVVRADVPGISKDALNVVVEKGVLTITGERTTESEKTGDGYYLRERSHGSYSRSFQVPSDIDDKSINATLRDGVLQLILQRSSESKPRQIDIE